MDLRCDCPLEDEVHCERPADGEDGLCALCRELCADILAEKGGEATT